MKHRIQSHQGGFTLIELVVVLSLLGSLLGGTIGVMTIVRKSDTKAKQNLFKRQELRRFSDDFRNDVHSAETLQCEEKTCTLTVKDPPSTVVYQIEAASIRRRKRVVDSPTESTDRYRIGPTADITVRHDDETQSIEWTIVESDRPEQPLEILAASRTKP